ncbi:hypothetical protein MTQ13_18610, partial [Streptomyces sp. XM4011]|nr:hypothetical protein [Streptomyces sp. XM4011]
MSAPAGGWVLGVDSGGSGLRVALAAVSASGAVEPGWETVTAPPVGTGPAGIDAEQFVARLLPAGRELLARAGQPGPLVAACVGAAGMATLGAGLRERLPGALADGFGVRRWALAADAVTGYAGALGMRPGVVVAAGTGMIALGTDLRGWRRADGWGHLLGDCGGGAWIGGRGVAADRPDRPVDGGWRHRRRADVVVRGGVDVVPGPGDHDQPRLCRLRHGPADSDLRIHVAAEAAEGDRQVGGPDRGGVAGHADRVRDVADLHPAAGPHQRLVHGAGHRVRGGARVGVGALGQRRGAV